MYIYIIGLTGGKGGLVKLVVYLFDKRVYACMRVCVCTCVRVYTRGYTYVRVCVCTCVGIRTYVCACVRAWVYVRTCVRAWVYVRTCVRACVYVGARMCVRLRP